MLAAVLMVLVRAREELAPALLFAAVGTAMGAWVTLRPSRASPAASVVVGLLRLLQLGAYTVAGYRLDGDGDGVACE